MTQIELRFMEVVVRQLPLITKELNKISEQLKVANNFIQNKND